MVAVAIGFLIAFTLALVAYRRRWLINPVTQVTGVLYTIPSIAAFFLLLPITGRGFVTAIVALVAYVLLIIFRNVLTGLDNVPDETKDAGRGMGLTDRQLLWRVEVPLAMPEIMAGLRIAVTTTVGLATLAFFAGAGGLGEQIFADINFKSNVVTAGGLAVGLAALLDGADPAGAARDHTLDESGGGEMNDFFNAIEFIFNEHESPAGGAQVGGLANMWELTWEHLQLSLVSLGIACAIAVPLGLWLGHTGKGGFLAINASNVGRAVPSLALIAFFVAYIGVGFTNLMLALVLLAIPPILTNAYTGVRQVDRDTVDSARGMGMTGAQVVRRVELPLALPLIFGGIRISAVNVIATADDRSARRGGHARRSHHQREHLRRRGEARGGTRRGPARGRHGVGPRSGAARRDPARTEAGRRRHALASLRNGTAQQQEGSHHMRKHRWLMLLALLVAALAVAGCGDDSDDSSGDGSASTSQDTSSSQIQKNDKNSSTKVTIGSKNFTEQKVLGEIYAQALDGGRVRRLDPAQPG